MRKFLASVFSLSPYPASFPRWRAISIYAVAVMFVVSRLALALPGAFDTVLELLGWEQPYLSLVTAALLLFSVAAIALTRRGDLASGAGVLVTGLLVESTLLLVVGDWGSLRGWAVLWMAVVLGGLLLSERINAMITGYALLVATAAAFKDYGDLGGAAQDERLAVFVALALWTLMLGGLCTLVMRGSRLATHEISLEETSRHLIELGHVITNGQFSRGDIDEFLIETANHIQQRFESIYHVQLYLAAPNSQSMELRAATGVVGAQLMTQAYALDIGGLSVVGRTAINREPLLIADMRRDSVYHSHDLLPETRTELAIPLVIADQVVGALDVQSVHANAFEEIHVAVLTSIAQQIAMAVDGLRLYQAVGRSEREKQALHQQTQASLREIERLKYQFTGRAWSDFIRTQETATALTVDFVSEQVLAEADWTPTLEQAVSQNAVITDVVNGRRVVALPVVVRDEVVGAMEFELDSQAEIPDGALDLIEAVGQRLGLAMENRRLLDETQRTAQREALINDIGTELQAATGVDAIMQRAAHHLQEALDAHEITIRLGVLSEQTSETAQEKSHL
ncbi:MAG: GAF domain-containing protein [Anaerolineae bacterium]|nr:GAF domain-containing protein [Anaerolineae bacterium]